MALPASDPQRPGTRHLPRKNVPHRFSRRKPCPQHPKPGTCPLAGRQPGRQRGVPRPIIGLPIFEREARKAANGETSSLFRSGLALFGRRVPPPPPPQASRHDLKRALKGSLYRLRTRHDAFDAACHRRSTAGRRRTCRRPIAALPRVEPAGRLGRVSRRRSLLSRVTSFTNAAVLRTALQRVSAALEGDGTIPESVYRGVEAALPPAGRLDWPTGVVGDASTKLLVLLGDAPDHETNLQRAKVLASQARAARITIAAVELQSPLLARSEASLLRSQWRALAEGGYRPVAGQGLDDPLLPILPRISPQADGDPTAAVEQIARAATKTLVDLRATRRCGSPRSGKTSWKGG